MDLLRPLLLDNIPSVQQSAAQALGRLANYSDELAEAIVTNEILPQLVFALSEQNKYYKRSAAYVLRSVAKHSPRLAQAVVDSGAIESLVDCLEEFDPQVKEAAAWALGYIAKHSGELAQAVVSHDAVSALVLCVQEPELPLKRVASSALSYIARHSPELAQSIVDAEAIPKLTPLIESPDPQLKRQICSCLSHIATHSTELAELVVEGEIFPKLYILLKDNDKIVRRNACTLIREIVKHTKELSKLVVTSGALLPIVDFVSEAEGDDKLPGIMTLGFISAYSDTMAQAVIEAKAIAPLGQALSSSTADHVKAASAWTLGQIGRHSSDHSRAVASGNILSKLMNAYLNEGASEDLQSKSKRALKAIIENCNYLDALNSLLHAKAPENILKYVVARYASILPNDVEAKKNFVTSRGMAKLQVILEKAQEGTPLFESIQVINSCYPEEVVRYYTPGFDQVLVDSLGE